MRKLGRRPRNVKNALVGKWFHTFDAQQRICWQGRVLAEMRPELYLVQIFSWFTGGEVDEKMVSLDEMRRWAFYEDKGGLEDGYARARERARRSESRPS
jgi:hypothetical protein